MDYDDYPTDTSRLQEMNQLLSQSEYGRPILPEDWKAASGGADQLNTVVGDQFSPLDDNPIAQRLAGCWVAKHVTHWQVVGERAVDERFCPGYDDSNPDTMSCYYVLLYPGKMCAYPISGPAKWEQVAAQLAPLDATNAMCFANITLECRGTADLHLVVKRGEYLCVFTVCSSCHSQLDTLTPDSPEYTGPPELFDDRTWQPNWDGYTYVPMNPWTNKESSWAPPKPQVPPDDDPWSA
ncbi:hypothetical protein [Mycobacterium sp. DL440]|uniref:hypothetical protein n=1 Tax=Mycobacterium sp. DL440 TaxID=2675523 RepID=UPI0014233382|nr:hypothetical protein [Mycobacterium sp. DL440]